MALGSVTVTPATARLAVGAEQQFTAVADGVLALVSGAEFNWTSLIGCAVEPNGALKDNSGGGAGYGVSGGVSDVTIDSGDGWVEWMATVPFVDPLSGGSEFDGRAFFGGLTTQSSDVIEPTDIEFGLEVGPDGVSIYEQGVLIGTYRASRNNGRYYVGVESGQVVYRVDDQVIYRSEQPVEYPLRFGTCFFHRLTDQIGGVVSSTFEYTAYDEAGAEAGSWVSDVWTAPDARGRYRIVVNSDNYVYGTAVAEIAKTFPYEANTDGFPLPSKFRPVRNVRDFKVNELVMDDQSAFVHVPLPEAEPVKRWRLEWNNLSAANADILDAFFDEHKANGYWFYFHDKYAEEGAGDDWDNVRIESYEDGHRSQYSNSQQRRITLIRRPV